MKLSRRLVIALAASAALAVGSTPFTVAQPVGAPALATRSNDADGVRVVVTPKAVAAGSAWEFEVVMDTHTKPLSDDLTKAAVLIDDGGRRYLPLAWQGDPPGGHHREGVLRFPAPADQIKAFELQIQIVGAASKRLFQWNIK